MSLIEGVGDEVTIFLLVVLVFAILALAWLSTNVSDLSTINVIVIDRHSFQRLLQRIGNLTARGFQARIHTENSPDSSNAEIQSANTSDVTQEESPSVQDVTSNNEAHEDSEGAASPSVETPSESNESPTNESTQPDSNNEASASTDAELLDPELLRKTRLAFFEKLSNKERNPQPDHVASVGSETASSGDSVNTENNIENNIENNLSPEQASGTEVPSASEQSGDAQNEGEEAERLEGHIRIRLKYLNDQQRLVQARPEDTIGEFKRQHFATELAENLLVRCIFNGQELRPDSSTLQSYNVGDQSVIHCLSQAQPTPEQNNIPEQEEWDIGSFMFPLFGVILVLTWYCRFTYRQYFNAMSTFSLIGITLMYVVAILATWRTHDPVHPHQE